jgi:hypothetical protein
VKKNILFSIFLLDKWTTYFTSFLGTPNEPMVKFCSKHVLSSFFLYFLRSSYMQPCRQNCPRAEGHGDKKEICIDHRILVFYFFSILFFLMVLHDVTFIVAATICMWIFLIFSRNFTRSTVLKSWVKTSINKIKFSSLIIINMELRFEPCVLNLIQKWCTKDPKKKRTFDFH